MIDLSAPFLVSPYGQTLAERSHLPRLADDLAAMRGAVRDLRTAEAGNNPTFVRLVHGMTNARHGLNEEDSVTLSMRIMAGGREPSIASTIEHRCQLGPHPLSPDTSTYDATRARLALLIEGLQSIVAALLDPTRLVDETTDEGKALATRYGRRLDAIAIATQHRRPDADINAGIEVGWATPWNPTICIGLVDDHRQAVPWGPRKCSNGRGWCPLLDAETTALWSDGLPPILRVFAVPNRSAGARDAWTLNADPWTVDWRDDMDPISKMRAVAELPQEIHA